jgi:uncharacterized protein YxjI
LCWSSLKARAAERSEASQLRIERMYVIRERFFSIGDDFDIVDDHGDRVFHVDGKVFSVRNKLVIEDLTGAEVASVHRHLVALHPTYEIRIGGEKAAEVRKKLFTPFREKFTIDAPARTTSR